MMSIRWAVLLFAAPLTACFTSAPTETLNGATKAFEDVLISSTQAMNAERKARLNVRRSEALMFWLKNGDSADNIDRNNPSGSFNRYLCAGSASVAKPGAFLGYASSYGNALKGITTPGADMPSGQWKKLVKGRQEAEFKDRNAAPSPRAVFDACVAEASELTRFSGVAASDTADEAAAASAVVEAYGALITSLENSAADTLAVADAPHARKKLSSLVMSQHEKYRAALSQSIDADALDRAWQRRKAVSLWKASTTFNEMIRFDRVIQSREIMNLGRRLQGELAEYDALEASAPPSEVTQTLALAEAALFDFATNKDVSVRSLISFLQGLQSELAKARSAFADDGTTPDALSMK